MTSTGETNTVPVPEQARSKERRAQVLAAALRLLLTGGSAGVTHRRVAEESGSSPGVVRYYFRTREDLLAACLDQVESSRAEMAEQILGNLPEAHSEPEQTARWAIGIYYGVDLDDVMLAGMLWSIVDCARESPRLAARLGEFRQAAQHQLGQLLSRCGYPAVTPSLATAILDGRILTATLERTDSVEESALTELEEILRLLSSR